MYRIRLVFFFFFRNPSKISEKIRQEYCKESTKDFARIWTIFDNNPRISEDNDENLILKGTRQAPRLILVASAPSSNYVTLNGKGGCSSVMAHTKALKISDKERYGIKFSQF